MARTPDAGSAQGAVHQGLGSLDGHGTAATRGIGLAELHLDVLELLKLAVFVAEEAGRVRIRGENPWSYDETPGDPEVARVKAFYQSIVEGKHVNEAAQGVEATLSTILGRTAAYRGREYGWDERLQETETLEL